MFDNGVDEVRSWLGINLMAIFHDITQNTFWIFAKISHPAEFEIYFPNLELAIWAILMTRWVPIAQYATKIAL